MKKILFVDTWSKGQFFTDPVAFRAKQSGLGTVYLHADKFYKITDGSYYSGPYDKIIDLDHYNMSVTAALRDIAPDVVIFISMHGMFHRWVNSVCEKLGVPTLFFMHGVRFETSLVGGSKSKNFQLMASRGLFYTIHWWYCLRDNLQLESLFKLPCRTFIASYFEMITHNTRFSFCPKFKWGLKYDVVCLNTRADRVFFEKFLGVYRPGEFVVSGHLTSRRAALESLRRLRRDRKLVLFISQPLVSAGYISLDGYVGAVKLLRDFFSAHDFGELVIRLHPRDDERLKKVILDLGIRCSENTNLADDLAQTSLVVGFNSSALIGCTDVGIPVVGLKYGDVPLLICLQDSKFYCELDLRGQFSYQKLSDFVRQTLESKVDCSLLEYSENIVLDKALKAIREKQK